MKEETLKKLILVAQREMPTLLVDTENASTHHALQPLCARMIKIMNIIIRGLVENEAEKKGVTPVVVAAPAPSPAVVSHKTAAPAPAPSPLTMPDLPDLVASPRPSVPAAIGLPPDAPFQPGVTNAFVTPQGTKVVKPDGAVEDATLPPPTRDVEVH
jgi:hypothetical protein